MSCKAKLFTFLERVAFIKKQKYFVVVTSWLALHWRSQDEPIIYLILSDLIHVYMYCCPVQLERIQMSEITIPAAQEAYRILG